ncbi:copper resistance CopC/CopD family protein [Streptomyces shenzhenensis]|uniref:copper resistance CopC/CopD family protein n=1 Tax=Streptomyces shenzhenensis TaxID=943815 RepID=UPI002867B9A4|nr:copper resistance protein CopC [Streptomyces shenzhenensis]
MTPTGNHRNRTLRALALLGTLLAALLLASATPAAAHAALRGSDPADGAVLKSSPRSLTLTFTESVGLLDDSFRVYDPTNHRVTTGEAEHGPAGSDTARITFPKKLGTGTFTVAWRIVSADSHPISGALTFSVGKPSATRAPVPTGADENPVTGSLYNIGRYVAYTALALLIGAVAFMAVCRPPDPAPLRRPVRAAWWALLASTLFLFVLRSPYEEGTSPATAFDLSALAKSATGRPGLALLTRVALLALTAALYLVLRKRVTGTRPSRPLLATAAVLSIALALTWSAAEHASAGIQVPLAMTSSVLHLLSMALWLGGLTALLITLQRSATPLPAAVVARFSRVAFAAVTVLVGTGVYQSWRGLGSWQALTDTSYGRLLLLKLAAVALLLAAASQSRRWTAKLATAPAVPTPDRVPLPVGAPAPANPPTAENPPPVAEPSPLDDLSPLDKPSTRDEPPAAATITTGRHQAALRRSVLTEVAVGVAVLGITTILTGTLPGRAAAEAAESGTASATTGIPAAAVAVVPFDVGTPNGHGKVQITLDPGRVGANSVQAVAFGPDGGISSVPELRLSFTLAAQKIGPLPANVTDRGGYWAADSVNLPIAGEWTMSVTVRVSDLDQVTVTKKIRIAA